MIERLCVFGGQYGSEGKGSVSEWLATRRGKDNIPPILAIGDNGPNSGHTCSLGKTKNIPAASFFADVIALGPDSAISAETLADDIKLVYKLNLNRPQIYIHECAAVVDKTDKDSERPLVERVSSTGSGAGYARHNKYFNRNKACTISAYDLHIPGVSIVSYHDWLTVLSIRKEYTWIFECSQGVMLDVNLGLYPFVTARSTLPHVSVARNGLASEPWEYYGVYRTFPIRTGGPSGPCYGNELSWEQVGVAPEIASVTGRVRRVFEWNWDEFNYSTAIAPPDYVMLTHCDYLKQPPANPDTDPNFNSIDFPLYKSSKCGEFKRI